MSLEFVAVDWETANGARGSACAVGIVQVLDGAVAGTWSTLIQPPDRFSSFDPRNTAVHGLRAEDVMGAPRFVDIWPTIEARLTGSTVIAHNAKFDLGVVQDATWATGHRCPRLRYGCTLLLARRHYALESYTLDVVATAAGVPLDRHHDARSDALAAAEILLRIAHDVGAASIEETFTAHGLELGWSAGRDATPCRVTGPSPWVRLSRGQERPEAPTLW